MPLPFDVIDVDDIVEGIRRAIGYAGDGYICLNLATGESCSLNLLADAIAELVPGCVVERGPVPQPVVTMDSSLAYQILGWKALPRRERLTTMLEAVSHTG